MLFACENDMETINSFTTDETLPDEMAKDIQVIYSDSGRILIKLISPLLTKYETDDPYMEFPEGIRLLFYDSVMNIKSELTADYGINRIKQKIMEVKGNVVINNYEKDEVLNTEHIVWDQKKREFYSNVFVKRTTHDDVIYGDGFTADESLTNYKLIHPRGVFAVEDDTEN